MIDCKWIYKIKTRSDGSVERYKERYKAHLVAQRFTQEYSIDYEETFTHVARLTYVCSLLGVAATKAWPTYKMDVKNAFLNGNLTEEVYMKPLSGSSVPANKVCHFRKALYGLKQASRAWFSKFSTTIAQLGFTSNTHDSALFTQKTNKGVTLLLLYVDDMIITRDDAYGIRHLKSFLHSHFEMKDLGLLSYFLGLKVKYDSTCLHL